jgi:hypothetical protein
MGDIHKVWASSFANSEDIRRFRKCKIEGGYWLHGVWHPGSSDKHCFEIGDNGIGFWGQDVSEGSGPACALPPEVIEYYGLHKDSPLIVKNLANDVEATVLVRDHMPDIAYLEKHDRKYRIDLNPDACHALGIPIPAEQLVTWRKA